MSEPTAELSGAFGAYEIVKPLGRRGPTVVYLARQPGGAGKEVVLEILQDADEDGRARALKQAASASKVSSDHVVRVVDAGVQGDQPFAAVEPFDASSAAALVKEKGPLPWGDAARIVKEAARGLAAAQAQKVLHRGLDAESVLVAKEGGAVKVAHLASSTAAAAPYAAPEQASGAPLDERSVVYSLGAVFYELLAGKPLGTEPPSLKDVSGLPPNVERACLRMLARDPGVRTPSFKDALESLERLVPKERAAAPAAAAAAGAAAPAWTPPRPVGRGRDDESESSYVLPLVLGIVLIVLIVLFIAFRSRRPAAPKPDGKTRPTSPHDLPAPVTSADVPEPERPDAREQPRSRARGLYTEAQARIMSNNPIDAERMASEGIDLLEGDAEERPLLCAFYVMRAAAQFRLGRFADAQRDCEHAEIADAQHIDEPVFLSYCVALLANDEATAARRLAQMPASTPFGKAAAQLQTLASTGERPASFGSLSGGSIVLEAVRLATARELIRRSQR